MKYSVVTGENSTVFSAQQVHDYTFTMVGYEDGGVDGSYDYDSATGMFSVWGCGSDVWGYNDHFSYLCRSVSGDFSLTVKLNDFPATSNNWAKAGLMVREGDADGTLPDDSRYVAIHTQRSSNPGDACYRSVWRNQKGCGVTNSDIIASGVNYSYPNWQKIERVGNVITCYYSENGVNWTLLSKIDTNTWGDGSIGSTLPLYIGMFVTSHSIDSSDACAYFSEVNFMGVDVKPTIIIQPRSQTVIEGGSVTLSVVANGTTPLNYQWYKGSTKITGATSSSYKISSAKTSDAGSYKVIVSNSIGSVTSNAVTLTVYDASQGFAVTSYQSNEYVGSTDDAEVCIEDPTQWRTDPIIGVYSFINFSDFQGVESHFNNQVLFPCQSVAGEDLDYFVILAEADVIIPEAGYWSFGVESDDGFKLDITGNGVDFSSEYSGPKGAGDTIASFDFPTAGSYRIRLLYFEATESALLNFYAAKGQYDDSFNDNFRLVGDTANGGLAVGNETVNVKPTITTQPKSQTVNEGSSVTFSVTATGTEPLSYQWKKNGSNISGATSSSYKISSAKTSDAGSYIVTVSNNAGSVTSSAATLTVNPVLSSISINGSSSVNVGSTATYTCTATYSNGTTKTVIPTWAISVGASYASITSAGVLTGKASGIATVQAKYTDGGVTKTTTKNVTVNAIKPTITTQPKSQTVNEGSSVTFSVVATGTTPLSYQWKKNGSNISGASGSSYTISSVKNSDEGSYTVLVSNSAGSVISSMATLTVNVPVTLSSIAINGSNNVNVGSTAAYTCTATYSNGTSKTVTPTWSISSGANYASITSAGVLTGKAAGTATIQAKYTDGSVTKTVTKNITVNETASLPKIITQPKSQTVNEGDSVTFTVVAEGDSSGTDFSIPLSSSINLDMVWINPGTFTMGSPTSELGREELYGVFSESRRNETQHKVTLTKGYWLGKYEITQAQYETVMGYNPSSDFSRNLGENMPVEAVTWYNATDFCAELTAIERAAGRLPEGYEYTLPTEAQWEYACRAGTTTALNSGKNITAIYECPNLDEVGWYNINSDLLSYPVGLKQPNAWGLYDMHGNVEEWCLDWYGDYSTSAITDPTGPVTGEERVLRGGSWNDFAFACRSAYRMKASPGAITIAPGFRVALVSVQSESGVNYGDVSLTYQWYKDGKVISGATSSSYTIKSVKGSDAGKYTVKVCNSAGCVTSEIATLTVNPILSSISISGNSSVNVNSTATYTCTATYSNGTTKTVIPTWSISSGANYASITSAGVLTGKAAGTATVQAKFTDGGVTKTEIKNVSVNAIKPTITTQPKSQTVNEGSSVTFGVTATGTAPLSYQWKKNGSNISGANSASYSISSVKVADAGSYTVIVTNSAGSVTSSAATLTVNGGSVDPNGTAVRSVKRSGKSATVTLKLEPDAGVSVMFVEEHVPSGVSISVNDGGTYVASRNMIRWSFLDGNARDISYVLTVADSFDGKVSLSGEVTFDETTVTVTGSSEIDFAILTHPADMNDDFEITTKEISSYALAWTKAQNWSREPVDIPVTYVSRAAIIWVNGGYYDYDPSKIEPSCWVSMNVKPASVELAADSVNVRCINVLDGKAYVSVEVVPQMESVSISWKNNCRLE